LVSGPTAQLAQHAIVVHARASPARFRVYSRPNPHAAAPSLLAHFICPLPMARLPEPRLLGSSVHLTRLPACAWLLHRLHPSQLRHSAASHHVAAQRSATTWQSRAAMILPTVAANESNQGSARREQVERHQAGAAASGAMPDVATIAGVLGRRQRRYPLLQAFVNLAAPTKAKQSARATLRPPRYKTKACDEVAPFHVLTQPGGPRGIRPIVIGPAPKECVTGPICSDFSVMTVCNPPL
jgi:hypothetical protein